MDKLDKFNNIVIDLCLDWKNIFYFVAGLYVLSTILYIGKDSRWGLAILSWAILVFIAIIMIIVLKKNNQEPPEEEA